MDYYCTLFDINYSPYGLTMYSSLKRHSDNFVLFILCLDDETHKTITLMHLPEVKLISVSDLENSDNSLISAKKNRSKVEYFFTCKPYLLLHIFDLFQEVNSLTYVEADLFFYANPNLILHSIEDYSILITPHNFSTHYSNMAKYGMYNAGWMSFKKDENSLKCLSWWRNVCYAWCYKELNENRYGDQKYLDEWENRFNNVRIVDNKGANLGTWNIENYNIRVINNNIFIDNEQLIFFHFHSFKKFSKWIYFTGYVKTLSTRVIREKIYKPFMYEYIKSVDIVEKFTKRELPTKGELSIRNIASFIYRLFISKNYIIIKKR
tara:strand:+ start:23670 stop:24632 length:963 start_codon:yes stop_codon:yes gene_type:complete